MQKMLLSFQKKRETELFGLIDYDVDYKYFKEHYDTTIYNTVKQTLKQN